MILYIVAHVQNLSKMQINAESVQIKFNYIYLIIERIYITLTVRGLGLHFLRGPSAVWELRDIIILLYTSMKGFFTKNFPSSISLFISRLNCSIIQYILWYSWGEYTERNTTVSSPSTDHKRKSLLIKTVTILLFGKTAKKPEWIWIRLKCCECYLFFADGSFMSENIFTLSI